jgi:hypothetical protein
MAGAFQAMAYQVRRARLGPDRCGTSIGYSHDRFDSLANTWAIIFVVRESNTSPIIADRFTIGNGSIMGEVTVPAIWEHIRRFMEDNGPHLPLGEEVRHIVKPSSFWQCMAARGPYGHNFRLWWSDHTALMIIALVLFPITFALMTLAGVFSWETHKTSLPIAWPPSVISAIGSPPSH